MLELRVPDIFLNIFDIIGNTIILLHCISKVPIKVLWSRVTTHIDVFYFQYARVT